MSRIHCIEHVPFETPGHIADWIVERGHAFTATRVYQQEPFPGLDAFDALVVMGGPMGVHDGDRFAWLAEEKRFIEAAMQAEKRVLGVCLGSQLIADVLGARVYRNRFQEIGWFPVHSTEAGRAQWSLPSEFTVFHWHGDTFDLPKDAVHLAKSAACEQQMFSYGAKVLGMLFHAEVTRASIEDFVRHGSSELGEGPYVQSASDMGGADPDTATAHSLLDAILDRWSA